ncbi:MAG: glutathione S-transferase C-terminal domain-containing protein [SAR324 cluster bacterium]|nr:glutathione S-transferase C-terminal domain-containing protein [SAR324 cluster bacterium]
MGRTPLEMATVDMWERRADFGGMLAVAENFRNRFPPFAERAIPGAQGVAQIPELVDRGRDSVLRFYGHLERRLSDVPYLAGETMTLADISAMCVIDFALFCEIEISADCPHLRKWYDGMEARESAKAHPGLVGLLGNYSKMMAG